MNDLEKIEMIEKLRRSINFYTDKIDFILEFSYSKINQKTLHKIEINSMVINRLNERLLKLLRNKNQKTK